MRRSLGGTLRGAGWALLLLVAFAAPAHATRQVEEELVIDGRCHRMQATPLEDFLDTLDPRPELTDSMCTACWRGYLGTWILEDRTLKLLSLRWPGFGRDDDDTPIPLTKLFPNAKASVPATWFTGVLRVAQGRMWRYVHMGFATLYERDLYMRVEKGKVVRQWEVDNRREGFARSRADLQWVAIASKPPADDGQWHDGRTLETPKFRKDVRPATRFKTRGVVVQRKGQPDATFWIPGTPGTPPVRLPLTGAGKLERALPHVELTATWTPDDEGMTLHAVSVRLLEPGETIHHASYEVPDLEEKLKSMAPRDARPTVLRHASDLRFMWNEMVTLRGPLTRDGVLGVSVAAGSKPLGKVVTATGMLEKWVVTPSALTESPRLRSLFKDRGPGTYMRLTDPKTGALVRLTRK